MVDNNEQVTNVAPVEPVPPVGPVQAPAPQPAVVPAPAVQPVAQPAVAPVVQAPPVAPAPVTDDTDDTEPLISEYKEPWYKKMWRPLLAATYIVIVLFDFLIMPIVMESINSHESDNQQAVELALKFKDPSAQIQALKTFTTDRTWTPLTLMGGGLFHIAFGALLTGAAVTRGMERKEFASKGALIK